MPRTAGAVLPADMTRTAMRGNPSQAVFNNRDYFNGLPGRQTMQQPQAELGMKPRRQVGRNR